MEKRKTNILLELIDDMINEYPNTKEYIQQKLYEKCDREGVPTDKVILLLLFFFFSKFRSNTNQAYHITYRSVFRCKAL